MTKYLIFIYCSFFIVSCNFNSKKTPETIREKSVIGLNGEQISYIIPFTEDESARLEGIQPSPNRELSFIINTSDKSWYFYSDSTVSVGFQPSFYDESFVKEIKDIKHNYSYTVLPNNDIWISGQIPFYSHEHPEFVATIDDGVITAQQYTYIMKDSKWLIPILPAFVTLPAEDYDPQFGVKLIIAGRCYDDFSNTKKEDIEDSWLKEYREGIARIEATDWYVLSYKVDDKQFEINKTSIDTTHFHWDCGGFDMFSISPKNRTGKEIAYISGINNLQEGIIKSHFHRQVFIAPAQPYHFIFENVQYTLRAEGIERKEWNSENNLDEEGRINNADVCQRYKLYLSSGGVEQQLLGIESFSEQYVKLEFIGDLDGDGKPDFIFETATWYEDQEIMLFLSSKAGKGELVKYVARDGYSMAC